MGPRLAAPFAAAGQPGHWQLHCQRKLRNGSGYLPHRDVRVRWHPAESTAYEQ
jgi:hypothetical protein